MPDLNPIPIRPMPSLVLVLLGQQMERCYRSVGRQNIQRNRSSRLLLLTVVSDLNICDQDGSGSQVVRVKDQFNTKKSWCQQQIPNLKKNPNLKGLLTSGFRLIYFYQTSK